MPDVDLGQTRKTLGLIVYRRLDMVKRRPFSMGAELDPQFPGEPLIRSG